MDPQVAVAEYEQLKIKEREIKERLKILQPIVMPLIPEGQNVVTNDGYFYIQMRTEWTFSPSVVDTEERLEKMKEDEIADGTAVAKKSPTLYYRSGKPKEHEVKE